MIIFMLVVVPLVTGIALEILMNMEGSNDKGIL